jgi:hypothetical protein
MRILYFAYGLSLEEYTMTTKKPSAQIYCFGILKGFKLSLSNKNFSIKPATTHDYTEGLIYSIEESDLDDPVLPSKRSKMDVMTDDGRWVNAYVYYVDGDDVEPPNQEELERILKKYGDYGFNKQNIERALLSKSPNNSDCHLQL